MHNKLLLNTLYPFLLLTLSIWTLASFLVTSDRHLGINDYQRSRFMEMVDGSAYKPFVYRTLLPATVKMIVSITPESLRSGCTRTVVNHLAVNRCFTSLGWEPSNAFHYLLATILMLFCFMGFGHFCAGLLQCMCNLPPKPGVRLILAAIALLGLPPFFRYVSYVYDPPQLFLFTTALYFLAVHRLKSFILIFPLCCLNKETAILLVPLFGMRFRPPQLTITKYRITIAALIAVFVGTKVLLFLNFRENPGSFLEFHLLHNIKWLAKGWKFSDALVVAVLGILLSYRWNEKPFYLKASFLAVLPPLIALTLFFGFLDEWRDYYEAYPPVLCLIVYSLCQMKILFSGCGNCNE